MVAIDEPRTALPLENAKMRSPMLSTTRYELHNFAPFNPTLRHSILHWRVPINDPCYDVPSSILRHLTLQHSNLVLTIDPSV
jgi:hypothetical protein